MKKNIETIKTIAIVVLILIIVFGISFIASNSKNSLSSEESTLSNKDTDVESVITQAEADSNAVTEENRKASTEIGLTEYLDLYNSSENKIIYIWKTGCSYCETETPIIEGIAKEYDLEINALNLADLSDEDTEKFIASNSYYSSDDGFGTPLLLVVKDGEFVDKVTGLSTKDYLVSFFTEYGFINK